MGNTHKDFHCRYCGSGMAIIMSSNPRVDDMKPFREHEARCLLKIERARRLEDEARERERSVAPPRRADGVLTAAQYNPVSLSRYAHQAYPRAGFGAAKAPDDGPPRETTMNAEVEREEYMNDCGVPCADPEFACDCGALFYTAEHLARHRESLCWELARREACRLESRYRIAREYYDHETMQAAGIAAMRMWARVDRLYQRGFEERERE